MKNKLDIITKFTLTFGITGMVATCIGIGINIAGATAFINPYFKKTLALEVCIKKVIYSGNLLIGSGLIALGGSIAVAKYVGENCTENELEFVGFNEDEKRYLELISGCKDCKYFHGLCYGEGDIDLICAVHPHGNTNCLDFEPKSLTASVNELNLIEPDECDLTERDELIACYGFSKYEFVKDQEWISDDLEHYLGKHQDG